MPGIRFVADSTADLTPAFAAEHRVITVPLKVIFGDEVLVDGVDVTAEAFYERMRNSTKNPTTSQPSPAEFEAAFKEAAADGSSVVCTTISADMSGTYSAAMTAREQLPDLDIHVVDTRSVTVGHAIVLHAAIECAESGAPVADVVGMIEEVMRRQRTVFTVETLEYLKRGGRIGGARALLGSVLNIKPVLQILEGRIEPFDRVRTYGRALDRICAEVISASGEAGRPARVILGHADKLHDCQMLARRLAPHCDGDPEIIEIGPIVGCHAGPGTIGVSFYLPPR
jgi:fatty acid kinase fatty acid binding subunit